jgi:D-beta-D-heptose 7-phosphate kinase/D-beta-D-heptose 1-phosphate adenosyltransferase
MFLNPINTEKMKTKKPITVTVSGGFDPIHAGHVRLFKKAKALGDRLIVILNNDNWLKAKKGYIFMPEKERKEIIEALRDVDKVMLTGHKKNPGDMSICKELTQLKPGIFANGGDRTKKNIPEVETCLKIGCRMIFNVGGEKIQSSSWLIKKHNEKKNKQA